MSAPASPPVRDAREPGAVEAAARALRAGELVGLPTETVYGLAADATNAQAVAKVYEAKARPSFNPLIIHVRDIAAARREGVFSPRAQALAEAFWPGPLTLVVARRPDSQIAALATAGLDTIALRAPAHWAAQAVLAAAERPLAAPSANRSGRLSPTAAAHVARDLGDKAALVLDAGTSACGVESSVVGLIDEDGPALLLRPGAIAREDIEAVVGPLAAPTKGDRARAPGALAAHYAPRRARLRLNADRAQPHEAYLGFGPTLWATLNLSPAGDLREAAANLFGHLRALDEAGFDAVAIAPIPAAGLGEAIAERLARAASVKVES